jgi:probable LLM family oxidoreductase
MEIGLFSFAETPHDPATGRQLDPGTRIRNLVEEIELADQVGLDVFGVGEHHRADYAVSAPAMVLAAAAARTERIQLTSAVTVLGSEDPVRVFQNFATLDHLSRGRAEIMAGRGSFTESFPLFGQDLSAYDEIFEEKLHLLLALREEERIRWSGRHRPPIDDLPVYPRPAQDELPIWLAVGGSPGSVMRAARLGLPMALAIIGGKPARFAPIAEAYREAGVRSGHPPDRLRVSINAHGFLADDTERAARIAYEPFTETMNRIGQERGWPPHGRAHFDAEAKLEGALFLGDPDRLIEKILYQHGLFGHDRFLLQLTVGPIPHDRVLRAIELFGTKVAPAVRRELTSTPHSSRTE